MVQNLKVVQNQPRKTLVIKIKLIPRVLFKQIPLKFYLDLLIRVYLRLATTDQNIQYLKTGSLTKLYIYYYNID